MISILQFTSGFNWRWLMLAGILSVFSPYWVAPKSPVQTFSHLNYMWDVFMSCFPSSNWIEVVWSTIWKDWTPLAEQAAANFHVPLWRGEWSSFEITLVGEICVKWRKLWFYLLRQKKKSGSFSYYLRKIHKDMVRPSL